MLASYQQALICSSGSITTPLFFLIHGPVTSPSPCFSLELTALPPSPGPCITSYYELPKWSLPNSLTPVCTSHSPSFMQQFIPVSPCLASFLLDCLHRLPTCSSCAQISLLLWHTNTMPLEKGLSAPTLRTTNCSQGALCMVSPPHTEGEAMLSKGRLRNISSKLYINRRDSSEHVLTNFSKSYNLHEKGKRYIHWQKPTSSQQILKPYFKANIKIRI